MARQQSFTKYTCDRCARQAYIADGDPQAGVWRDAQRYTADGVSNSYLLCSECYMSYRTTAMQSDNSFNQFMADGKTKNEKEQ